MNKKDIIKWFNDKRETIEGKACAARDKEQWERMNIMTDRIDSIDEIIKFVKII